ncbi:hypothetical protein BC940DRAFT_332547 [Gongronella butleri]|nr:hypothetical protein BC940DRAFT_332547 [Gongronella butleri]
MTAAMNASSAATSITSTTNKQTMASPNPVASSSTAATSPLASTAASPPASTLTSTAGTPCSSPRATTPVSSSASTLDAPETGISTPMEPIQVISATSARAASPDAAPSSSSGAPETQLIGGHAPIPLRPEHYQEIWEEIFKHVSLRDLVQISRTCRAFRRFVPYLPRWCRSLAKLKIRPHKKKTPLEQVLACQQKRGVCESCGGTGSPHGSTGVVKMEFADGTTPAQDLCLECRRRVIADDPEAELPMEIDLPPQVPLTRVKRDLLFDPKRLRIRSRRTRNPFFYLFAPMRLYDRNTVIAAMLNVHGGYCGLRAAREKKTKRTAKITETKRKKREENPPPDPPYEIRPVPIGMVDEGERMEWVERELMRYEMHRAIEAGEWDEEILAEEMANAAEASTSGTTGTTSNATDPPNTSQDATTDADILNDASTNPTNASTTEPANETPSMSMDDHDEAINEHEPASQPAPMNMPENEATTNSNDENLTLTEPAT